MSSTATAAVIVPPNGGRAVKAFGNEIQFKLTSEATAGALVLGLATIPAGSAGPPMHVHDHEDELFIIVEGDYRVCVEGNWSEAGPGSVVFLPRGLAHTFHVAGDRAGKHWVLTNAAGFDRFYAHSAEALAQPGAPDFAVLGAIAAAHGYRYVRAAGAV
ncbi:Cupin 2 conserved barrel domain protein [Gemmatirosa kalamazoonensis]|uniref:Cupin 2 conserved barrel domain protein n=1 Tax=Gemmatirosa kalamazoonensis TaxID=861299 RepID=W0RCP1_9BACT|nr:cupin domain-containing protein [Gemmatirosa kalamazoonensis]AHG88187.1 Cupin 2 conserved barrel domain protein [Gemmatirosa kalamazoonensis]